MDDFMGSENISGLLGVQREDLRAEMIGPVVRKDPMVRDIRTLSVSEIEGVWRRAVSERTGRHIGVDSADTHYVERLNIETRGLDRSQERKILVWVDERSLAQMGLGAEEGFEAIQEHLSDKRDLGEVIAPVQTLDPKQYGNAHRTLRMLAKARTDARSRLVLLTYAAMRDAFSSIDLSNDITMPSEISAWARSHEAYKEWSAHSGPCLPPVDPSAPQSPQSLCTHHVMAYAAQAMACYRGVVITRTRAPGFIQRLLGDFK
jgi:hypothetical protein